MEIVTCDYNVEYFLFEVVTVGSGSAGTVFNTTDNLKWEKKD